MEFERDYEQDVKINPFELDEEAAEYPSVYHYWGDQLAELKAKKDDAESRLKYMEGEKDLDFRNGGMPDGIKATADSVKAAIAADKDLEDLRAKLRKYKKAVYTIEAVVRALETKKSKIEDLRHLWIAGYYSQPSAGRSKTTDVEDVIRSSLNKGGH